jgi:hypothetical protein
MIPCFDCLVYFHLPVIDGTCIDESKLELVLLFRCPLAHQVVWTCLSGDVNYYNLYNECKLHLESNGRQVGIGVGIGYAGVAPTNQCEYEKLLAETLDRLGILSLVHGMEVPTQKHLARVMLMCLARIRRCKDYWPMNLLS